MQLRENSSVGSSCLRKILWCAKALPTPILSSNLPLTRRVNHLVYVSNVFLLNWSEVASQSTVKPFLQAAQPPVDGAADGFKAAPSDTDKGFNRVGSGSRRQGFGNAVEAVASFLYHLVLALQKCIGGLGAFQGMSPKARLSILLTFLSGLVLATIVVQLFLHRVLEFNTRTFAPAFQPHPPTSLRSYRCLGIT